MKDLSTHRAARSWESRFLNADDAAVLRSIGREIACETDEVVCSSVLVSSRTFRYLGCTRLACHLEIG